MIHRTFPYRGRFAPTPSGPLHLGSLLTALASYLQARSCGGQWLLRIDDLDRARCPKGADTEILRQLDAHGLHWDEAVRYQSAHSAEYRAALEELRARGLLYPCICTRERLRKDSQEGPDGAVYAGTCRHAKPGSGRSSLRLRVSLEKLCFDDGWQGRQCRELGADIGDFVVKRTDGVVAYQLACAIDENAQNITEVVRGADLLSSTFRQLAVQRALGIASPCYRHLPVLNDGHGRKLSKQNHAKPVMAAEAFHNLSQCLDVMGLAPPLALRGGRVAELLHWATLQWTAAKIPRAAAFAPIMHCNKVAENQTP